MNRRSTLAALGCLALLGWTRPARSAPSIDVLSIRLAADPDPDPDVHLVRLLLFAEFSVLLNETLRNAIDRGLPLHFVAEVQLERPRWYWTDDSVLQASLEWRVSYHALTRKYRLVLENQSQVFDSLDEALVAMSHVAGAPLATLDRLRPGAHYVGQAQLRLDTSRLPKPFQMTALTNSEWNPQSEWKRFDYRAPTRKSGP